MSYIHKFPCKISRLSVYLRIYLNKLLKAQVITWHVLKGKGAWDYYYIEIVKCYLCLALNHQKGASTLPCGSFEGPVMFANLKENKWFAVQVVRLVPGGVHKHRLSLIDCENGDLSTLRGNQCWEGSSATPSLCSCEIRTKNLVCISYVCTVQCTYEVC